MSEPTQAALLACPRCEPDNPAARYDDTCAVHRLREGLPVHYFDCDRFEVYNYGTRQGTCDCTATADVDALLVPSPAARAVVLLHEDYHAGSICFAADPVECAGHQDAHDITQVLVNAGLLAWGEADRG